MTLFGGADLNYRSVTSGTNKFQGMAQDGIYSSRFGVMGTEDLGGGLKAGFHFEGGMNPDTGTPGGLTFQRKSTIGLMGGFGEVRLGRDYTPLFTIAGIADPFGTNGVGSSYNLANSITVPSGDVTTAVVTTAGGFATAATATANAVYADPNAVRANNSVAYYSPSFSGFTAGLMYSFGAEATGTTNRDAGKMTSLKLQYGNGPLVVALGSQSTKGSSATNLLTSDKAKWATTFLAGSYNLGVAKVSAGFKTDKLTDTVGVSSDSIKSTILGVTVPMGATTLKASYVARKADEKIGNQLAFGAVHDLSKRTSVYGTYAVLKNEAGYGNTVGSAIASDFTGLKSKGFEVGVKHNF